MTDPQDAPDGRQAVNRQAGDGQAGDGQAGDGQAGDGRAGDGRAGNRQAGEGASIAIEALGLARTGDVAAALAVLRAARDNGPLDEAATSLLFNLLHDAADDESVEERLRLCDHGLTLASRAVTRSSWHLRRGNLHLAARDRQGALADFQAVLRLGASDDHAGEARKALLVVAQLPGAGPQRRRV